LKQTTFFENFAKSKGFDALQVKNWYSYSKKDFLSAGGKRVLDLHKGSHINALMAVYPALPWDKRKFTTLNEPDTAEELLDPETKAKGFWKDEKNLFNLAKLLEKRFNIVGAHNLHKWYDIAITNQVQQEGFKHVIQQYGGLVSFLKFVYPEHKWQSWRFPAVKAGYWKDMDNLTSFIKDMEQDLNIHKKEDWYLVTAAKVETMGGKHALTEHGGVVQILKKIYPEHAWQEWKWEVVPRGFWDVDENVKRFFEFVRHELGIKSMRDWYRVTNQQVASLGGKRLLAITEGGIPALLRRIYPDHKWDFSEGRAKTRP